MEAAGFTAVAEDFMEVVMEATHITEAHREWLTPRRCDGSGILALVNCLD